MRWAREDILRIDARQDGDEGADARRKELMRVTVVKRVQELDMGREVTEQHDTGNKYEA